MTDKPVFICNICKARNYYSGTTRLDRELPTCVKCGSSVRFRWIVHALSMGIFGRAINLPDFPSRPALRGLGLSDEETYASVLASRFSYVNTYFHRKPFLDITSDSCREVEPFDFIIASEVFEHIPPPVQVAFNNLSRMLKPTGFVLFSVPWGPVGATAEHFPSLYQWKIVDFLEEPVLVNRTVDGRLEVFRDLVFHGGPGQTLEMRKFALPALINCFMEAGLIAEFGTHMIPQNGTMFPDPWSIPCVVQKGVVQKA